MRCRLFFSGSYHRQDCWRNSSGPSSYHTYDGICRVQVLHSERYVSPQGRRIWNSQQCFTCSGKWRGRMEFFLHGRHDQLTPYDNDMNRRKALKAITSQLKFPWRVFRDVWLCSPQKDNGNLKHINTQRWSHPGTSTELIMDESGSPGLADLQIGIHWWHGCPSFLIVR